jgi:hypothetical protein
VQKVNCDAHMYADMRSTYRVPRGRICWIYLRYEVNSVRKNVICYCERPGPMFVCFMVIRDGIRFRKLIKNNRTRNKWRTVGITQHATHTVQLCSSQTPHGMWIYNFFFFFLKSAAQNSLALMVWGSGSPDFFWLHHWSTKNISHPTHCFHCHVFGLRG